MSAYDELDQWVTEVYGRCSGFIELTLMASDKKNPRCSHLTVDEWDTSSCLQVAENLNVYLGCCTVKEPPAKGRGKYEDRFELPGLWLDMDIGTVGHKPSADGLRTFEDPEEAWRVLQEMGYPAPSAIVMSGGGIYPWWFFETSLVLDPDERRDNAQTLSNKWHQHAWDVAQEKGIKVDKLGDLPRFLRPPGTINLKEGQRRPTRLWVWEPERRYHPNDLWLLVAGVEVGPVRYAAPGAERGTGGSGPGRDGGGGGLADALRGCSWADVLGPSGWTFLGMCGSDEEWVRPGKSVDEGRSALAARDVLTVFSDAAGLPAGTGKGLTKWRVWSWLWFQGNEREALKDLTSAVTSGEATAPWPTAALEWADEIVGMDLEFVKSRMPQEMREGLEIVQVSRRRIVSRGADGRILSTPKGSGYLGRGVR